MKRPMDLRRKKCAKRIAQNTSVHFGRGGVTLELLEKRIALDADGLAITSPAAVSVRAGINDVMDVAADDPDATFSILSGPDSALFSIDSVSGTLSFISPADHSSPADAGGDNVYDVTVQAQDNFAHVVDQAVAITILPANIAPTISADSRVSVSYGIGFVHGQDRFFQMDMQRRFAAGELSALVGPGALGFDKQNRVHGFREKR